MGDEKEIKTDTLFLNMIKDIKKTTDATNTTVMDLNTNVIRLDERVANHLEDKQIHQVPPCQSLKDLNIKLWALLLLLLCALGTIAWSSFN